VRAVFDTNVLARAYQAAHGPARRALLEVISGPHVLVLSSYILRELERVLRYPRLAERSGLRPADISEYLERLAIVSSLVALEKVPADLLRDPEDAPILGTALAGRADFLCTRDAHYYDARATTGNIFSPALRAGIAIRNAPASAL